MRSAGPGAFLLALVAAGCTPAKVRFDDETIPKLCAAASDCARTFDAEGCVETLRSDVIQRECKFSEPDAEDCTEELDAGFACETDLFGKRTLAASEACHAAYQCPVGKPWLDAMLGPAPR